MVNEFTLISRVDALPISVVVVRPENEPKAVLQLAHGMCGCKERFLQMMQYMADHGVACVAGDHRGHGGSIRSMDDLGYMYEGGYRALVDDMRMITEWARNEFPSLPLCLLGHSMGSMAARVYTKYDDSNIDGLIVVGSPGWNPLSSFGRSLTWFLCRVGFSRHRMRLSQSMASFQYNLRFISEGRQAWTCSDPQVRQSFADNPLCNFSFTANASYNLLSLMWETYRKDRWAVTNSSLPIVFLSGTDDPTISSERKFHNAAQNICDRGYLDVTSVLYPAMRHEILNEIGKEMVWDEILDFLKLKVACAR